MSDGAHLGVSADRALATVLGGEEQPSEDEMRNPDEMREWILAAPTVEEFDAYLAAKTDGYTDKDYGECARVLARVMLTAFLTDPRLATLPLTTEYDWDADPDHGAQGCNPEFVKSSGLSDELRARAVRTPTGMSGFQWGWAFNAARYCVELEPAQNPAIMEL